MRNASGPSLTPVPNGISTISSSRSIEIRAAPLQHRHESELDARMRKPPASVRPSGANLPEVFNGLQWRQGTSVFSSVRDEPPPVHKYAFKREGPSPLSTKNTCTAKKTAKLAGSRGKQAGNAGVCRRLPAEGPPEGRTFYGLAYAMTGFRRRHWPDYSPDRSAALDAAGGCKKGSLLPSVLSFNQSFQSI
jgi:hypothetical protein